MTTTPERNERGHHVVEPTRDDVACHVPRDTADEAYLLIGDVKVRFDPSSRESRDKAFKTLAAIRRFADDLESHMRVIRIAPEHSQAQS